MIEEKLLKLKKCSKKEFIYGLKDCGFEVFFDDDTESSWTSDSQKDVVVKLFPNHYTRIQLDWFCEATHEREELSPAEAVDAIFKTVNYTYKNEIQRIRSYNLFYNKALGRDYFPEPKQEATLDEKIELINKNLGCEPVSSEFIDGLKSIGINNLVEFKYENKTNYVYFTPEQWHKNRTDDEDYGCQVYSINNKTKQITQSLDLTIMELKELFNI